MEEKNKTWGTEFVVCGDLPTTIEPKRYVVIKIKKGSWKVMLEPKMSFVFRQIVAKITRLASKL